MVADNQTTTDEVEFDGYDEIDAAYYLITQHARKCRKTGFEEHAEELFELSHFLLDTLTFGEKSDGLDRDDYSVTVDGDAELDLLYETVEYAVEQEEPEAPVAHDDLQFARRVYVELGGEVEFEARPIEDGGEIVTDGGRAVETTAVYAHVASDGGAFVSFGAEYSTVEQLDVDSVLSPVEYVEGKFFKQPWADGLIETLIPERHRGDRDAPQVGTLTHDGTEIVEFDFEHPDTTEDGEK